MKAPISIGMDALKIVERIYNIFKRYLLLSIALLPLWSTRAQELYVPIDKVIESLKFHSYKVFTIGILSYGVPTEVVDKLTNLQTAPPRQMRIYLTQSTFIKDVYRDFTYLINNKKAEAIIIWPSEQMADKFVIKKICTMSKKKKIPVISLQEGWVESGAMLYFKDPDNLKIVVNGQIQEYMEYPINENPIYTIINQ